MKRSPLEIAFDIASGKFKPDCPGCGRPRVLPRWSVAFTGPEDQLGECPECGEPVDWEGAPVVGVAPNGERILKRVFLYDRPNPNLCGGREPK